MGKISGFSKTTFAHRFQALRIEHGYTMEELTRVIENRFGLNVSKGMISKYENGVHEPNIFFITCAAELFNVSENYLMGRSDNRSRSGEEFKKIPILGEIAAGVPILAQEDVIGEEQVPPSANVDFCLKIKGDSMMGARLFDGDIVFIRQQNDVENGEIAAVLVDDETATLKRVYKEHGATVLRSENPNYPERRITKRDGVPVKILGKAIFFKGTVL